VNGKRILVLGGTGSLGKTIVKECLKYDVRTVRVFSRNEFLQWQMQQELQDPRLRYMIGDIRDKDRLVRAMHKVDYVFHTAALKHIGTCEYNPIEAVRTNVEGTINVIDAAIDAGVPKVLGISTDKAVDPNNLYGATKLVMERVMVQANVYGETIFSCMRSGNFYGSQGSVVPLWQKQAEAGFITVTDPKMERYWITLEEAAKFAVDRMAEMQGGEIFIPKMSSKDLLSLAYEVAPGADIKYIGRRPGEKLTEALYTEDEAAHLIDCETHWTLKM
jgi:UDP-N-acetylglucosamine 4,6-dehydratase